MKKLLILLLFPLYVFADFRPLATNRYFSGSGNDVTGNGSQGNPYRSIAKLQSLSLATGDSIFFERNGTYTGELSKSTSNLHFAAYGSGAKPIFYYAGSNTPPNTTTFTISGNSVTFQDMDFTDVTQTTNRATVAHTSVQVEITGDNCTFLRCYFSKSGCGIFANTSQSPIVTYCEFNDMRMIVSDASPDSDYGSNGIIANVLINLIVTNCIFDSCFAPSVDYTVDGGAIESFGPNSNWTILRNEFNMCNSITEMGSGSGGTCQNYVIGYSKIINSGEIAYGSAGGGFPIQIKNIHWWNNVIIDTSGGFGFGNVFNWGGSMTADTVYDLRNNIFMLQGGIDVASSGHAADMNHTNNGYNTTSGSTVGYTLGSGEYTITNIYTTFVNSSAGNFNLIPGCSSEGAGQTIPGFSTADFNGYPIGNPPNTGIFGASVPAGSRRWLYRPG